MGYLYEIIIAVLVQAKSDYIRALKKRDYAAINELETFFLSDYGQAMSRGQGERIIQLCKKMAEEKPSCNVTLNYKGELKPLTEWARIKGLPANALRDRIKRGWSVEKALNTPLVEKRKKL